MASQITSVSIVCSAVCSGANQREYQSSASLALVRGIHRSPMNSTHKMASDAEYVSIWWRHVYNDPSLFSHQPPPVDPQTVAWFQAVDTDRSGHITARELQQALMNANWSNFNFDTCRLMIGKSHTIFCVFQVSMCCNFTPFRLLVKAASVFQRHERIVLFHIDGSV